ncbi:tape measure protein [Arsenophonus sp. PmNCSU2021_1]|uniref:tape measure protein n=1 Tax=Arsenophonus sp. PmNCSU2021_1 TaxID=3118989 RepID=UPI002FF11C40
MAEKKVKAAVIVDLLGTLPRQARLFGQSLVGMGRQGGASLHGLGLRANSLGSQLDRLGHQGQRTFSGLRLGLASVSSGFDHLETRAKAAYGGVARLYGLLAGGAALVGLKKAFIDPAAAMENMTLRLNSLNHHDKAQTDADLKWALQNAKDSTWGLQGVVQEYTASRGFGISREEARHFITMLEDQGARHGWTLPEAQGASLQLKQMYSRKSIQAQDASLLTGYGIDVYSVLAEKLGKSRNELTQQGEKGLLGAKSVALLFQALREQAKGAQKDAMNSWTGLTSQLGHVWQQFAVKVMNQGPFKRLKTELKDFLDVAGEAQESGLQDQWANRLASRFNGVFDSARRGVTLFKNGLNRVNAELIALRQAGYGDTLDTIGKYAANTAKAMLAIYVASKLARVGMAIARPAWGLSSAPVRYPWRAYRWWCGRGKNAPAGLPGPAPFAMGGGLGAPVSVLVTNWPAGGVGGGSETYVDGSGRTRRKGSRLRPGRPALSVPRSRLGRAASAVSGFFGGLVNRTGARLSRLPGVSTVGRWLSGVGGGLRDMGQRARGLLGGATARLSGFTGWLGRSTGALGRGAMRLGGPALTALSLAPTLLDKNASAEDKGGALGSATGATVGGLVGAIGGPIGAVAGSMLGSVLGEKLGGWLGDIYARWDKQDEQQAMPPPVKAQADMRIALAPGLVLQNSAVTDSNAFGLQLDVYNGDNYHIY